MNFDLICAEAAENTAGNLPGKDLEKLVGNCSSVLTRHGPYALFLYLKSEKASKEKHKDNTSPPPESAASFILFGMAKALKDVFSTEMNDVSDPENRPHTFLKIDTILAAVKDIGSNFEKLLLARKVLEQTLTYLRYHVKAKAEGSGNKDDQGHWNPDNAGRVQQGRDRESEQQHQNPRGVQR
jgi:hypothetical protein